MVDEVEEDVKKYIFKGKTALTQCILMIHSCSSIVLLALPTRKGRWVIYRICVCVPDLT